MNLTKIQSIVKKRQQKLKALGYEVKLGHLYEVQAQEMGYKNWAVASQKLRYPGEGCDYKKILPKIMHPDFVKGIIPLAQLLESLDWHLAPLARTSLDWGQARALRSLHPDLNPFKFPNGDSYGWWCPSNEDGDCHLSEMAGWVIDMVNSCSKSKGVWFPAHDRHEFFDFYELEFFKGHTETSLCDLIEQEGSGRLTDIGKGISQDD